MIKGIFFDVGGTLYSYRNIQPAMMALMEELAARLELEQDIAEIARHYRNASREADKLVAVKPFYLFRDYFEIIFSNFLSLMDRQHLHSHFGWFEAYQHEAFLGCMTIKPDCHDTLTRLKAAGLYLSAVSNADENMLTPLIERAQLHRWLTHWTSSEAAQSCKPDRRFFEIALKKSGLSPDQVLFVGDSLEQDILGAHAMGMTTVLITEDDHPAPMHIGRETPEPDFSITRLGALPEIIEQLGASAKT